MKNSHIQTLTLIKASKMVKDMELTMKAAPKAKPKKKKNSCGHK
jgi:hypothetical protein